MSTPLVPTKNLWGAWQDFIGLIFLSHMRILAGTSILTSPLHPHLVSSCCLYQTQACCFPPLLFFLGGCLFTESRWRERRGKTKPSKAKNKTKKSRQKKLPKVEKICTGSFPEWGTFVRKINEENWTFPLPSARRLIADCKDSWNIPESWNGLG